MVIKDRIASWYIKNVMIPGEERINTPGYLFSEVTSKGVRSYIRELALPERVFSDLETKLMNEYPNEAPKVLYAAGKKFSYAYASMSNLPVYGISPEKEWYQLADYVALFSEAFYANKITKKIDSKLMTLEMELKDFIICSKNGYGYLLTVGGAGLWAYVTNNCSVEGVQTECQGKGAKSCHLIFAPRELLKNKNLNFFIVDDLTAFKVTNEYLEINKAKKNRYSTLSLQSLIDSKMASYNHGQITFDNERYFVDGAALIYFLEKELNALPRGNQILFDTSFEYSKKKMLFYKKVNISSQFIVDLLSAFGWGDTLIRKHNNAYEVIVSHFPWFPESDKIELSLFSGMLSGFISALEKRDVLLRKKSGSIISGDYIVSFCE